MNAVTNAELDQFYGIEPNAYEKADAISRHLEALDDDDLCQVAQECSLSILFAIKTGNAATLLAIFQRELKQTVARRASLEVFGNTLTVKASEVVL